ncbi:MAG: hypothetical protein RLY50_483 [Actinomycetota bacterium]
MPRDARWATNRERSARDASAIRPAFDSSNWRATTASNCPLGAPVRLHPTRRPRRTASSTSSSPTNRCTLSALSTSRPARHTTERENEVYDAGGIVASFDLISSQRRCAMWPSRAAKCTRTAPRADASVRADSTCDATTIAIAPAPSEMAASRTPESRRCASIRDNGSTAGLVLSGIRCEMRMLPSRCTAMPRSVGIAPSATGSSPTWSTCDAGTPRSSSNTSRRTPLCFMPRCSLDTQIVSTVTQSRPAARAMSTRCAAGM